MYSIVLMAAMTTGGDVAACHRGGGCCGCIGSHGCGGCFGCGGGHGCFGGFFRKHHGCCGCCGVQVSCGCCGQAAPVNNCGCCGGEAKEEATDADDSDSEDTDGEVKASAPAKLIVNLPADAKLTIDGAATKATSARRVFVSPKLNAGKTYIYTIKAKVNAQTITKKVEVRAGRTTLVELNSDAPVASR